MEDLDIQRAQFNDLWSAMKVDETLWPRRYAATFSLWRTRSRAAQVAMLKKAAGGIGRKDPYFYVQDFPEPQPEWKTGGETGEDLVQVRYNGLFKICTRETMNLFNLEFVKNWN